MAATTWSLVKVPVSTLAAVIIGKDERRAMLRWQDQTRHVPTDLPTETDRLAGVRWLDRIMAGNHLGGLP